MVVISKTYEEEGNLSDKRQKQISFDELWALVLLATRELNEEHAKASAIARRREWESIKRSEKR